MLAYISIPKVIFSLLVFDQGRVFFAPRTMHKQVRFFFLSKTNIFLSPHDKNPYNAMVDRLDRKRTSIAAPEKRSLEAYFAVQPRPSGEKIAAIAEKLDLKKNVVRVWFCNQRQKQKRMKFAAQGGIH